MKAEPITISLSNISMHIKYRVLAFLCCLHTLVGVAQEKYGAIMPWTTYEAERMTTNGTVLGKKYAPYRVETESSGQQCVRLDSNGQYVEFPSSVKASSLVIRYSLPDASGGKGMSSVLGIYRNGRLLLLQKITSRYTWLYGKYPFTNDPAGGSPRHFYDEVRIKGLTIAKGDMIRIQLNDDDRHDAAYCIIDLVDLEAIAPPVPRPANSLSITDPEFAGAGFAGDYTHAFRNCIASAIGTGKNVWIPAGTFTITGDILLPANITIQGAGMWYTELVGDDGQYADANKRVRLKGNGSNIHIAGLAITGNLDYRSDKEENDGIVGSFGMNSTISKIWIEHTKVGMWIENSSGLTITDCRMRNTMADGINFCVGMNRSVISNCTARGTGDDCFAIWPAVFAKQQFPPGDNLITNCTAQLPFLANGAAIYGGKNNSIQNCCFTDISQGSAILISTTFPTENRTKGINNNFSGTTTVDNCDIHGSGGFDHEWDWRAAVEICLDKRSITGLAISNIHIDNSLSNGFSIIAKNDSTGVATLTGAVLKKINIGSYGIGTTGKHGLFIAAGAQGKVVIKECRIPDTDNESGRFTIARKN